MKVDINTLTINELMLFIKQNINKYAKDKEMQGLLIDYYALCYAARALGASRMQEIRERTIKLITILFGEKVKKPVEAK